MKPHDIAAPEGDEKVFVKHTVSAFMESKLPDTIKSYGHRKIVVIGMDGGQCVNDTTRHGADLGYDMVVVGDACASMCSLVVLFNLQRLSTLDPMEIRILFDVGHTLTLRTCRLWSTGLEEP